MNIEKKYYDNKLKISVDGRIDTETVVDLEKAVPSLEGIQDLTFDFDNLEYISSSGLRFILKCKKAVDSTKVINCNPGVYEIFNVTGFSEMMKIKKAYRKLSIENCEKIGEGFFGEIYRLDPETIVKVYKVPDSLDLIQREQSLARRAFVLGIPTAIPYDIVKVGDLYGTVFELLNAKSIVNLINNNDDLDDFAKKTSDILKVMHSKEIEDGALPSRKKHIINLFEELENYFSKESYNKIHALLESIPERNTLLHCDFHVKNIMMQNDDLLLIDMDNLSVGHPIFEFGAIHATYEGYSCIDKKNTDRFLGMPLEVTTKLFNKTLAYYYDDKAEEELEDIKTKCSVIGYIQILRLRSKFKGSCKTEEEEIKFCIKYLSEIAEKLDTLNY